MGHFVGRSVLLTLNYDHIHMSSKAPTMNTIRPITAQVELGMPWKRGIRPRLGLGAGVYLRKGIVQDNARIALVYPVMYMRTSSQPFGLNVGGGLSAPLSGNTLLDLDIRFHQITNRSSIMGIVGLGISYMWH
jgi:opacity protein-like surface antigen